MITRHKHSVRRQSRRGLSIAEVTIAATALSVLTVIGITIVCLLMTAEQRAAESIVIERVIATMAGELRRDAHTATTSELTGKETEPLTTLSLRLADDSLVTYECTEDGVWRQEQQSDGTTRREKFHLPFGTSWFDPLDGERLIVWRHAREVPVTMSFSEPSTTTDQPQREFRIKAALGTSRELTTQ